jgi:methionine-S-sulfoxide reductase
VQVTYDPSLISYEELLVVFWTHHDPTDNQGQFVDRGLQYRPAVFYHSEEQRILAEKTKQELENAGVFESPVVTEITEYASFHFILLKITIKITTRKTQ